MSPSLWAPQVGSPVHASQGGQRLTEIKERPRERDFTNRGVLSQSENPQRNPSESPFETSLQWNPTKDKNPRLKRNPKKDENPPPSTWACVVTTRPMGGQPPRQWRPEVRPRRGAAGGKAPSAPRRPPSAARCAPPAMAAVRRRRRLRGASSATLKTPGGARHGEAQLGKTTRNAKRRVLFDSNGLREKPKGTPLGHFGGPNVAKFDFFLFRQLPFARNCKR